MSHEGVPEGLAHCQEGQRGQLEREGERLHYLPDLYACQRVGLIGSTEPRLPGSTHHSRPSSLLEDDPGKALGPPDPCGQFRLIANTQNI